ncbi:chamberlinius hualienesis protein disulfide isomerase 2 [Pelomyxa schiedti]|nr:chamberlinius hualienesis protein disulfide isomerase 2 [Pelomyxa schiedti]
MKGFIAVLLLLVVVAWGQEADYDDSDVLKLNAANFDATIQKDFVLVKFFAPWCGHCKHLAPEFAKAATIMKNDDPAPILAEVDCTVESELASRFQVQGYPTLKIFRNGQETPYNGPREADGIVRFVRSQAGPAAKLLATAEAFDALVAKKDDVTVMGFFSTEESKLNFMKVANTMREDFRFALVTDAELINQKNAGKEGIVLIRPFEGEEPRVEFTGDVTDATAVKQWVQTASLPVVGILKATTEKRYNLSPLPKFVVFTKVDEVRDVSTIKYYTNRLRRVAAQATAAGHPMLFCLADKSNSLFTQLTFEAESTTPRMAIVTEPFKFKADKDFTVENANAFVESYFAGTAEKFMKSQPIPETNDGPVKVVVARSFDEEVVNNDQDVFIKFYAPWCGHCKHLAPIYEQLAEKMKAHKTLKIVEYDASDNEVPPHYSVQGFPTLYLAKANDKGHPIAYDGEREVDAMEKWLREHVANPLDTEQPQAEEKKEKKEKDKKDKKEKKKEKKEKKEKDKKEKKEKQAEL